MRLGSAAYETAPGTTTTVRIALTRAGRTLLAERRTLARVALTVTARDDAGVVDTATTSVKLTAPKGLPRP